MGPALRSCPLAAPQGWAPQARAALQRPQLHLHVQGVEGAAPLCLVCSRGAVRTLVTASAGLAPLPPAPPAPPSPLL